MAAQIISLKNDCGLLWRLPESVKGGVIRLTTEKILFYVGLALVALSVALFIVRAFALRKKQSELSAALDSEYGPAAVSEVKKCQK